MSLLVSQDIDYVNYGMVYKNLKEKELGLEMTLYVVDEEQDEGTSPSFLINDSVGFTMKYHFIHSEHYLLYVKFYKLPHVEDETYIVNFTSNSLDHAKNKQFCANNEWYIVTYGNRNYCIEFDVDVTIINHNTIHINHKKNTIPPEVTFVPLHEDEKLTDFELQGEDGAVRVHRFVLAAASPVLRRMLCGTWKETTEGHVEVQGTTKSTLQDLKDYIYLNTLPETGLEQLMLLASYYMMHDLQKMCVEKLMSSLTAQNVCTMLEFASGNKMNSFLYRILESFENRKIRVKDVQALEGKKKDEECQVTAEDFDEAEE